MFVEGVIIADMLRFVAAASCEVEDEQDVSGEHGQREVDHVGECGLDTVFADFCDELLRFRLFFGGDFFNFGVEQFFGDAIVFDDFVDTAWFGDGEVAVLFDEAWDKFVEFLAGCDGDVFVLDLKFADVGRSQSSDG